MHQVSGSGRPANEMRNLDSFSKISDNGSANVFVKVGPSTSVKVEGDDNIVPLVKTRVEDDRLIIETKKSLKPKTKLLVTVTMPHVSSVELNGAANITVHGVKADDFSATLDGAGNVTIDGTVAKLDASLDGAGNLKLQGLRAVNASASIDGAGNIDLWVTDSLNASIDGMGNIHYIGSPHVTKSVDGLGKVEQKK